MNPAAEAELNTQMKGLQMKNEKRLAHRTNAAKAQSPKLPVDTVRPATLSAIVRDVETLIGIEKLSVVSWTWIGELLEGQHQQNQVPRIISLSRRMAAEGKDRARMALKAYRVLEKRRLRAI